MKRRRQQKKETPDATSLWRLLVPALLLSACDTGQKHALEERPRAAASWVGNQACASCHSTLYAEYLQTGMGRSFSRPDPAALAPLVASAQPVHDPNSGFTYTIAIVDSRVVIRETRRDNGRVVHDLQRPATYQVGSGNHTISFIEARNGYLYEMPLTWYSGKRLWHLSPGYEEHNFRFDRPINGTCLNCHTAPSAPTPQTENHFAGVRLGIGCENCHGPGSEHVRLAREGMLSEAQMRKTIVNPAWLSRDLQMDVCQRCHLEGLSIWHDGVAPHQVEVGKPLAAFKAVFVSSTSHESEDDFAIAAQADRLRKSACFQQSDMTCTTCHDPHRSPALSGRDAFNQTCASCHGALEEQVVCAMTAAASGPATDCVACHMHHGGTSDIPHVTFTDHYIRRTLPAAPQAPEGPAQPPDLVAVIASGDAAERAVQRGLAYYELHQTRHAVPAYLDSATLLIEAGYAKRQRADGEDAFALGSAYHLKGEAAKAESYLRQAVQRNPGHARAHYVLGRVLLGQNRASEAAAAFLHGVSAQPKFIENRIGAMEAYLALGNLEQARIAGQAALALDSLSYPQVHYQLGIVYHNLQQLGQARHHYRYALRLDPGLRSAWLNLGGTYIIEGKWQQAVAAFDEILRHEPNHVGALSNKMVCLAELRQQGQAQRLAQRILQLDPDNPNARRLLQQAGGASQ